jgi:hypothetical protein
VPARRQINNLIYELYELTPERSPPSSVNRNESPQRLLGHSVRLTDERLAHIIEHPEMKEMGIKIERVLLHPQLVRRPRADEKVRLFYEFYAQTIIGGKWLCVVLNTKSWMPSL